MNFQSSPILPPLRILVINSLCSAARLIITKILSGSVFGNEQLVDLILLAYSNDKAAAEDLKLELKSCGFACMNSIEVTTDLPMSVPKSQEKVCIEKVLEKFLGDLTLGKTVCPFVWTQDTNHGSKDEHVYFLCISDADIFCFMTNLKNPNSLDFCNIDNEQFDALYLIVKVGYSLSKPLPIIPEQRKEKPTKKIFEEEVTPPRLIIMSDGIIPLNILKYLMKDTPGDVFFCPTPLPAIAKIILGEHLKVNANDINDVLIWAANDEVFHIEVEKPIIMHDVGDKDSRCDWDMIGKDFLESLDHTQFNESWMRKEFINKVLASASNNPYGCIYRASVFAKTLKTIWMARCSGQGKKTYASMGVISDGSLQTLKGLAYVLPLVFVGDTWNVNKRFEESSHLQQEIKRMNETVKQLIDKLIPYCKKFLKDNVINQMFIPSDDYSVSLYSSGGGEPISNAPSLSQYPFEHDKM